MKHSLLKVLLVISASAHIIYSEAADAGNKLIISESDTSLCAESSISYTAILHSNEDNIHYDYIWMLSTDSVKYKSLKSSNKQTITISTDKAGTYYYKCIATTKSDTIESNIVSVTFYDKITGGTIEGNQNICHNTTPDMLTSKTIASGGDGIFSYQWQSSSSSDGSFSDIDDAYSKDYQPDVISHTTYYRRMAINECGVVYSNVIRIEVQPLPETTTIVRKPNSNILVCKESDESLIYQWGYTDKGTNTDTKIDNSNHRYVHLPHSYDNNKYDYWLKLTETNSSLGCFSLSVYDEKDNTLINIPTTSNIVVSQITPTSIPFKVNNPTKQEVTCKLYSMTGELLYTENCGNQEYIDKTIDIAAHGGVLMLQIFLGNEVSTFKTIVK